MQDKNELIFNTHKQKLLLHERKLENEVNSMNAKKQKKQFRWSANKKGNKLRDGAWRDGKNTQIVAQRAEDRAMREENAIENVV